MPVARQYLNTYQQRGLTIIISDFLDEDDCVRPLQFLADSGHELLLVQLWNEDDRNPSDTGEFDLVDAETGAVAQIAMDEEARAAYAAAFESYSEQIRRVAERNGGRYAGLSTRQPLEEAIFGPAMLGAGV